MPGYNVRTVGPLTISWVKDRYIITFYKKKLRVAGAKAKLLWILAEYPDQMIPLLYIYREMYGHVPASKRPNYRILQTLMSQLRNKMRFLGSLSDEESHLRSNYQGAVGLFSTAAPLPVHEKRRKGTAIKKLLAAQKE